MAFTDDNVDQMLILAERLRADNGGQLDDSAIQAVAEATGAPLEYVRLAVKLRTEQQKHSFIANVKGQYLTLEPHVRRYVMSGFAAAMCALFSGLAAKFSQMPGASPSGIFGVVSLLFLTLGLYNACVTRDAKTGATVGGLFGGGFFAAYQIFGFILGLRPDAPAIMIASTLGGALAGLVLHRITDRYRSQLGLRDPVRERQELLRQLVDLQDKLKSGEQSSTFLSVDIVGSTRMKELADPLAVEFTFNEYHQFVERIVVKYGGRVHSTAGDGMTCAFDHPQPAFGAAKNIQAGLIELNTHRNKVGVPIQLRQGIHTGTIMTAEAGDIKSVNFAHVIDIASHLQKMAPTGGIAISDSSAAFLPGGPTAVGIDKVVASGVPATIWQARTTAALPDAAGPPPLPDSV